MSRDLLARRLMFVGGLVTVVFGAWHAVVPWLYHWFAYIPEAPKELVAAIVATNFFLAVALVVLGVQAMYVAARHWHQRETVGVVLWCLTPIWLIRTGYQILLPQGTAIPGLAAAMTVVFALTTLCFIVPLAVMRRGR